MTMNHNATNQSAGVDDLGRLIHGKKPEEALGLGNERIGLIQGISLSAGGILTLMLAFTVMPFLLAGNKKTKEEPSAEKQDVGNTNAAPAEKKTGEKETVVSKPKQPINPVLKGLNETKTDPDPKKVNPFASPDDDLFNLKGKKKQ